MHPPRKNHAPPRRHLRHRGVAAILAMMFLVIFSSLAAAMAIIAQGNLSTAEAHLRINRALSGAETGMQFVIHRLDEETRHVLTRSGLIEHNLAQALWFDPNNPEAGVRTALFNSFFSDPHNIADPEILGETLRIGPIAVGPGEPQFTATFTPHPILSENYVGEHYQNPAYQPAKITHVETYWNKSYDQLSTDQINQAMASWTLDATWIRVRVTCSDGPPGREITRTIQMDFKMNKRVRYAVLSRSRVMIGRHVMIEGPVASVFTENDLQHGHPVQMVSDFRGLTPALDANLDMLAATLAQNDTDFDNRINLNNPAEVEGIDNPEQYDINGDGFIDDYDFFLGEFANANGDVTVESMIAKGVAPIDAQQLMELIDTFGDPGRPGWGDGVINMYDNYAKIRGEVMVKANWADWFYGAGGELIQDHFQGPIHPGFNKNAFTFGASDQIIQDFTPQDFNTAAFRERTESDIATQALDNLDSHDPNDPNSPQPLGETITEEVPFGSAYPYDYYDRPVYRNMRFENVRIPRGTNALFINCTFVGVTYIETETGNTDRMFNYAGIQESNGEQKHPDRVAIVIDPITGVEIEVPDTKTISNNLRFENCTFEGAVVADSPHGYTHVRNKIAFTGKTRFNIENSTSLSAEEKSLYRRSALLVPHWSVEMGTFVAPHDSNEKIDLSGTIVAGIIDMRGNVQVNGSVVSTFEPISDDGPVQGETSPQFNTTLGYFSKEDGDLETEVPVNGVGVIQIRYDPTIPLPDGVNGPIEIVPVLGTYIETR